FHQLAEQDHGVPERVRADIGKAQTGGALPPCRNRAVDGLERISGHHAIMAQPFDFEQPAVSRKTYFAQLRQIVQPLCATLSPSGSDDSGAIQSAIDNCPVDEVLMLNSGAFIVNNYVLVWKGITLRGSGAGKTTLKKTNGARPRTSQVDAGT